ncbi:MAG: hypothetical protein LBG81_00615, partial [Coriobacteriaceae bacterium]|nr:hypothetical protein [Coriobacteriaceae bacterium]
MGFKHKHQGRKPHTRLSARFVLLVLAVVAISSGIYFAWNHSAQQDALVSRVLSEARSLNREMLATWDYIDASQDRIN